MSVIESRLNAIARLVEGDVVTTIHGNKLKRFEDGWSPLEGAYWDRWTVYSDREVAESFPLENYGGGSHV